MHISQRYYNVIITLLESITIIYPFHNVMITLCVCWVCGTLPRVSMKPPGALRNSAEKNRDMDWKWVYFCMEIVWKWGEIVETYGTLRKSAEKNRGMEISLFLCGNGQKSFTITFLLLYVDNLIGNKTWKNGRQQKIHWQVIFEISGGHNFSWSRIFN